MRTRIRSYVSEPRFIWCFGAYNSNSRVGSSSTTLLVRYTSSKPFKWFHIHYTFAGKVNKFIRQISHWDYLFGCWIIVRQKVFFQDLWEHNIFASATNLVWSLVLTTQRPCCLPQSSTGETLKWFSEAFSHKRVLQVVLKAVSACVLLHFISVQHIGVLFWNWRFADGCVTSLSVAPIISLYSSNIRTVRRFERAFFKDDTQKPTTSKHNVQALRHDLATCC